MPWEEDREDGSAAAGLNAAADADGSTVFADDALAPPLEIWPLGVSSLRALPPLPP